MTYKTCDRPFQADPLFSTTFKLRSFSFSGSSAESVGACRTGQGSKSMIEGDFSRAEGTEPVRFSERQFQAIVEALGSSGGKLVARPKPVKEQGAVSTQHAGYPPDGLQARAQSPVVAASEETPPTPWTQAVPEKLEILLQQVSPHRFEVMAQQFGQLDCLPEKSSNAM